MFAIIKTGGRQYKVAKGETLDIEKLEGKEGDSVNFDKILLISNEKSTKIGTPFIQEASVAAKIVKHKKGEKIIVFKMKAKKRYQKTQGHRQNLTTIEITDIKEASKAAGAKIIKEKTATKSTKKQIPKTKKAKTTSTKEPLKETSTKK